MGKAEDMSVVSRRMQQCPQPEDVDIVRALLAKYENDRTMRTWLLRTTYTGVLRRTAELAQGIRDYGITEYATEIVQLCDSTHDLEQLYVRTAPGVGGVDGGARVQA